MWNVCHPDHAGAGHAAYDLNNIVPSPSSELEPTRPSSTQIVKCIRGGAESDTNSSVIDSGDEWDKTEVSQGVVTLLHSKEQNWPHLG